MDKFIAVMEDGRERLVNASHVTSITPMVNGSVLYGNGLEFPVISSTPFDEVKTVLWGHPATPASSGNISFGEWMANRSKNIKEDEKDV